MATITGFYKDNTGYVIDKDPEARLSYQLIWSEWLPSGDIITNSTWTIDTESNDADPVTESSSTFTNTTTIVTVNGGTAGTVYRLYNTITTDGGLIDRKYFRIKVKDRSIE
jgi:hypothetical protein